MSSSVSLEDFFFFFCEKKKTQIFSPEAEGSTKHPNVICHNNKVIKFALKTNLVGLRHEGDVSVSWRHKLEMLHNQRFSQGPVAL